MKKFAPITLAAVAALLVTTALPAQAVTTSVIPVPNGQGPAAVDTSTKLVYVGTTPPSPANPEPGEDFNSSAGVAKVDPGTKRVLKSVTVDTLMSYAMGEGVSDVKVSSTTNDLWVLVGFVDVGGGCWSVLHQLNKVTLTPVRTYRLGCARKVELDPTSRWAYLTEAPYYDDRGDNAQPTTKATVVAVDGATGSVSRATVPSPTTGVYNITEQFLSTSIAFDRKNYGIYVVGQSTVWVYTTKLQLVHTTKFGYDTGTPLSTAANLTTNLIYVTDGKKVTEISGPTGNVTRTSVIGGGSTMVIDTSSNVLYLGTNTVNLATLTSTGKQAYKVQAVDPTTHARYWFGSGSLYVTK